MSISTDGQLCFGIQFDDSFEFPWGDRALEDWWCDELNFKHSFEIWNEDGTDYIDPKPSEEMRQKYHKEKTEFLKNNPPPVKEVNYCSGEYPMYILAIPSTVHRCNRGYTMSFDPEELFNTPISHITAFFDFVRKYNLSDEGKWYLSSYWG